MARRNRPPGGQDDAHGAVDQRQSRESRRPREHAGLLGHGLGAAELCRARRERGAVGAAHDLWVEDRQQRRDVPAAGGSQEDVGDVALAGEIGVGTRGCALDPVADAAGELLGGGRGALHDRSDLVERYSE
jgi:hypothetical protein